MAKFFKIPFAATGDILAVPDATQPDGSVSYSQGFGPDYQRKTDGTDPLAKTVPRNSTNALFNDLTGAVGEIQLNGVPAWQSVGAPYPINAIVRHNNKNWISQVANNSITPIEGASWSEQPANSYTKAQVDTKLATKANTATTIAGYGITDAYTKAQVDASLSGKANVSTTIAGYGITDAYTKTQTDSLLASKANSATTLSGYGITDAYTKAQVDTALSGKANTATTLGGYGISDAYTKTESDSRYLRTANNLSDLPNKATARSNLELGSAAQATLTASPSDVTPGRVTKTGDSGLNINDVTSPTATSMSALDVPGQVPSGMYILVLSSASGGVDAGTYNVFVRHVGSTPKSAFQELKGVNNGKRYGRYINTSTTEAWREEYNSGNQISLGTSQASARTALGLVPTSSSSDQTPGRLVKNGDKQISSAWVNFNGKGVVAIRDSLNVTSITDNGVGDYTVLYTENMANVNYAIIIQALDVASGDYSTRGLPSKTVSSARFYVGGNASAADYTQVSVSVFGGK